MNAQQEVNLEKFSAPTQLLCDGRVDSSVFG